MHKSAGMSGTDSVTRASRDFSINSLPSIGAARGIAAIQPLDRQEIFGDGADLSAVDQQAAIGGIAADGGDGLRGLMRDAGGDLP